MCIYCYGTLGLKNKSFMCLFGLGARGTYLVAQMVKNLPTMKKTRIRSLGQENPLEKEMATHSSILAWRIPWTEG